MRDGQHVDEGPRDRQDPRQQRAPAHVGGHAREHHARGAGGGRQRFREQEGSPDAALPRVGRAPRRGVGRRRRVRCGPGRVLVQRRRAPVVPNYCTILD